MLGVISISRLYILEGSWALLFLPWHGISPQSLGLLFPFPWSVFSAGFPVVNLLPDDCGIGQSARRSAVLYTRSALASSSIDTWRGCIYSAPPSATVFNLDLIVFLIKMLG